MKKKLLTLAFLMGMIAFMSSVFAQNTTGVLNEDPDGDGLENYRDDDDDGDGIIDSEECSTYVTFDGSEGSALAAIPAYYSANSVGGIDTLHGKLTDGTDFTVTAVNENNEPISFYNNTYNGGTPNTTNFQEDHVIWAPSDKVPTSNQKISKFTYTFNSPQRDFYITLYDFDGENNEVVYGISPVPIFSANVSTSTRTDLPSGLSQSDAYTSSANNTDLVLYFEGPTTTVSYSFYRHNTKLGIGVDFTKNYCDTDMDGTFNSLDLDSDADGCFDALEANSTLTYSSLSTDGVITSNYTAVDTIGTSQDASKVSDACITVAADDSDSRLPGEVSTGNLLTNDEDPNNDTQMVTGASYTHNGTTYNITIGALTQVNDASGTKVGDITINSIGTYTFTPVASFTGSVPTIAYTIKDVNDDIAGANLNITYSASALPLELAEFEVSENENNAVLTWKTLSEQNNSHFEVERSIDGVDFYTIGEVEGAGDSNEALEYSFTDGGVGAEYGAVYYRLRQVDYFGAFDYSNLLYATFEISESVRVFPNPVTKNILTVGYTGVRDIKVEVYDVYGGLVLESTDRKIDFSTYHAGSYLVKVVDDSNSVLTLEKVVVLK